MVLTLGTKQEHKHHADRATISRFDSISSKLVLVIAIDLTRTTDIKTTEIMEEQLMSFETAKLAKEKGFILKGRDDRIYFYVLKTVGRYKEGDLEQIYLDETCCDTEYVKPNNRLYASTQSLLQKWLREIHNINVQAYPHLTDIYRFYIEKINFSYKTSDGRTPEFKVQLSRDWSKDYNKYKTYEEALEVGLQEALRLI